MSHRNPRHKFRGQSADTSIVSDDVPMSDPTSIGAIQYNDKMPDKWPVPGRPAYLYDEPDESLVKDV
jgi:hypothetical protein